MKRFLLALTILGASGLCMVPLGETATRVQRQWRATQAAAQTEAQQLAQAEAEQAALRLKLDEAKRQVQESGAQMNPALMDFLLSIDQKNPSREAQERLLGEMRTAGISARDYLLISKARLSGALLKALHGHPNPEKLTDAARGVLAVTTEEQRTLEAAFAEAFDAVAAWAKANLKREGPSGDMLVRYTIPADLEFERTMTNLLFSRVTAVLGGERGELMRKFYEGNRLLQEDGGIGGSTNVFSLHRIPDPPGLAYRAGWMWPGSESVNTYPEPIKPGRFPYPFFFVFPGGWQEVAQREGLDLPEEFKR